MKLYYVVYKRKPIGRHPGGGERVVAHSHCTALRTVRARIRDVHDDYDTLLRPRSQGVSIIFRCLSIEKKNRNPVEQRR